MKDMSTALIMGTGWEDSVLLAYKSDWVVMQPSDYFYK